MLLLLLFCNPRSCLAFIIGIVVDYYNLRPEKLAPDACPAAKNRKRFDPSKSATLSVLMAQENGDFTPMGGPRV